MLIRKEQFQQRLALLLKGKASIEAKILELQANLVATGGAIQDCEYWIAQIVESEETLDAPKGM